MRITNISDFAGGASAVRYREIVNGEKRTTSGELMTGPAGEQTAVDLSDFSYKLGVQYGTMSATVTSRDATITNLQIVTDDQSFRSLAGNTDTAISLPTRDLSTTVAIDPADPTKYNITWNHDTYPADAYVTFNGNTDIPVIIGTLYLTDAADIATATASYAIRYIMPVRYGVQI